MKNNILLLFLLLAFSCRNTGEELYGDWRVNSKFYKSTCRIFEEDKRLKGLVLSYDDGTTRHRYDGKVSHYLFENLKEKDGLYIDVISGATIKKEGQPTVAVKLKNQDTLLFTTYIMDQPLTEIWIREK